MRTTVNLDDRLVKEASAVTGAHTKNELLHSGMLELVRRRRIEDLLDLIGKPLLRSDRRALLAWRRRG